MNTPNCYRCGSGDIFQVLEDGSSVCYACEDRFQTSLFEQYPHGQCWTCGAPGEVVTCEQGKDHVVAWHVEGVCSQWRDPPPLSPIERAMGYCSYGCKPDPIGIPPQPAHADDDEWVTNMQRYVEEHQP